MYAANGGGATSVRPRPITGIGDVWRRTSQLTHLLFNAPAHFAYGRAVEHYAAIGMAHDSSFQRRKYLGSYLALSLTPKTRRSIIVEHYRFVGGKLSAATLELIKHEGICLWESPEGQPSAAIRLALSQFTPMEGEWQLQFLFQGSAICTLSFLFASLPQFASREFACAIGGMQGGHDCRQAIREAARSNREISPHVMLVMAAKAVSQALGVTAVYGVSSREQITRVYAGDQLKADYDAIWASEGAMRCDGGFYALSHDLVERDLSDVPRTHRRRTRLKRERKAELLAEMTTNARAVLLGA